MSKSIEQAFRNLLESGEIDSLEGQQKLNDLLLQQREKEEQEHYEHWEASVSGDEDEF